MTSTGHPKRKGYGVVESIQFNKKTAKFEFYAHDLINNKKLETVSCQECHGKDPRPVNDSYPLWLGFYGSVLDSFPASNHVSRKEQVELTKFLSQKVKTGIYKYLIHQEGSEVTPYLEPRYLTLDEQNQATHLSTTFKPNQRFGIALTALNRQRIFRKIKNSPKYQSLQKTLLYELLNCGKTKVTAARTLKIRDRVEKENQARIDRMGLKLEERHDKLVQMQELKNWESQLKIGQWRWSQTLTHFLMEFLQRKNPKTFISKKISYSKFCKT